MRLGRPAASQRCHGSLKCESLTRSAVGPARPCWPCWALRRPASCLRHSWARLGSQRGQHRVRTPAQAVIEFWGRRPPLKLDDLYLQPAAPGRPAEFPLHSKRVLLCGRSQFVNDDHCSPQHCAPLCTDVVGEWCRGLVLPLLGAGRGVRGGVSPGAGLGRLGLHRCLRRSMYRLDRWSLFSRATPPRPASVMPRARAAHKHCHRHVAEQDVLPE